MIRNARKPGPFRGIGRPVTESDVKQSHKHGQQRLARDTLAANAGAGTNSGARDGRGCGQVHAPVHEHVGARPSGGIAAAVPG